MGHEVYVDCEDRSPRRAVEAVRRDVAALRPGASKVIVQLRDLAVMEAVTEWARGHHLEPRVEFRGACMWLHLYVLPDQFGALPTCARHESCRARGTRRTLDERGMHAH